METPKYIIDFYEKRVFPKKSLGKHLPFALFDQYCIFCRRGIDHGKDLLSINSPKNIEEGIFEPQPVWVCKNCYSELVNYHFQVVSSYASRSRMIDEDDLPFNLDIDDDPLPDYKKDDHPRKMFVSKEMKNAYLRILHFVDKGTIDHNLIFDTQRDENNKLIYECFFLFDVIEKDMLYFQNERLTELSELPIPFAPNQDFIDLYLYVHPLAETIIMFLQDSADQKDVVIGTNTRHDICVNERCSDRYEVSLHEYEKRKKKHTLGTHYCHKCLFFEGLEGKQRYFQTFCRNHQHSITADRTVTGSKLEPDFCPICDKEAELAYGYSLDDPMTELVRVIRFGILPFEENVGVSLLVKVLRSRGCGKYGCEVLLIEEDNMVEMYDISTDFRECGLQYCRCYKSQIKAMVETLSAARNQFRIELKDEEDG